MPQGSRSDSLGGTKENPLALTGDTPDAFGALCWILHALYACLFLQNTAVSFRPLISRPTKIVAVQDTQEPDPGHVSQLISLVLITHKYGFVSLELWSFNLVYRHCVSSKFLYTEICSAADLQQLLQVCQLTPDLDFARCRLLTQIIERNLLFRVMYDSESPLDDADALAIA